MSDTKHPAGKATPTTSQPASPAPARVLVVADTPDAGELRAAIEAAGFSVRGVRDPADAPAVAGDWQPHLVLIDACLSEPGPAELFVRVKERHRCTCVLLAPCATGEFVTLGHRSLADAVVVKPLNPVGLRRIIAQD